MNHTFIHKRIQLLINSLLFITLFAAFTVALHNYEFSTFGNVSTFDFDMVIILALAASLTYNIRIFYIEPLQNRTIRIKKA